MVKIKNKNKNKNKEIKLYFLVLSLTIVFFILFSSSLLNNQSQDIPISELPQEILDIVNQYLFILQNSVTLEEAASKLQNILGGGLLNYQGQISQDTLSFSLKKDFQNAKLYQYPVKITRVVKILNDYDGYKQSYIEGTGYKVWVAKKEGTAGLPAPVHLIKPKDGSTAKIIGIGSF